MIVADNRPFGPTSTLLAIEHAAPGGGDELTGTVNAFNDLTTIYPRLSGDRMSAADGKLTGTLTVPASGATTSKVQLGFVTHEIAGSRSEYDAYRAATPATAYTMHARDYNQWWADNVPYLDIPDKNVEKTIYYRWWLIRFNYLDADIRATTTPRSAGSDVCSTQQSPTRA